MIYLKSLSRKIGTYQVPISQPTFYDRGQFLFATSNFSVRILFFLSLWRLDCNQFLILNMTLKVFVEIKAMDRLRFVFEDHHVV